MPDDLSSITEYPLFTFCLFSFGFCLCAIFIYIQVFQFFLTIMAVQKFLLFFYPSSEKYIILSRRNMQYFIRYTYYIFVSKDFISFILLIFGFHKLQNGEEELYRIVRRFNVVRFHSINKINSVSSIKIFFASMNISFVVSAFLYIPILISVQKMSHLRSVQEEKPQIYIFWQTMTALVVKMIYVPYFFFVLIDDLGSMIIFIRIWDAFSVPVIIQISYLTCNRQNVITLFGSFNGRRLIKELIKPEATSRVGPNPRGHFI
ncbi:Protein CBG22600 [Caenorhabditis briggsae]|uniref:Protein CBG22600 n=1 Tax=Caenorhabditis briggsae TaxID=6238 RepID=A8Y2M9_CAEBR|nr:Protein CBG22600 [Caenorhabditis briggsae]CAP39154.1 Protein CBG22600 [Caenorhabditis briggsae]